MARIGIGTYLDNAMTIMRILLLFLLAGMTCLPTRAQVNDANQGTLGGGIGISAPTGEFDETWGRNMFKIGAQLAYPLRRVPILQTGFSFGLSMMGNKGADVPITSNVLADTTGEQSTRCRIFSYHPLMRLSPLRGRVRPYVDGMVGFRQFSTITKVTARGLEEELSKERNETDLAFSTGWAAGVQVTLGRLAYAEVRVERFDSGEATYVDPESVTVSDQGAVGFSTLTSNTDVVNVLFGLGLRF